MLLLDVRLEDRVLERARLLLPEDILGADEERERVLPEEDRVECERVLAAGADGWLAGLLPEVKAVCEGGAAMTIPLEVDVELTGCMPLLPIFLESLLLITIPWLPEYPGGIVDT